ncbi:hypothetical protein ACL02T_32230 [Pseudonocardia sp. RS010]|uniref:hypothetical protein n=1 Tax=Pseudonocardia sp. RS010 TaxID=3385979 RepID=UPI0039A12988
MSNIVSPTDPEVTTITLVDGSTHTPDADSVTFALVRAGKGDMAWTYGLRWTEQGTAITVPFHAVLSLA